MKPNRLLYLSQEDVVSVGLTMTEIIEVLEVAFREKGQGNTEMPPKPGIHTGGGDNFIHAMPAYIPGLNAAGVKWVSGFPGNQKKGLPCHSETLENIGRADETRTRGLRRDRADLSALPPCFKTFQSQQNPFLATKSHQTSHQQSINTVPRPSLSTNTDYSKLFSIQSG